MIGSYSISSTENAGCLAARTGCPSGQVGHIRALVRLLDQYGFHNVAFAIAKCASDGRDDPLVDLEMDGFVKLAKRLLKNEMPTELDACVAK